MGTIPPTGAAPSVVGGLTFVSSDTSSISVRYSPASGTDPISYAGFTSPHGSAGWLRNGGAFTGTGGTFTGLASGTSYDLRIVASNSQAASTTDLLGGVTTAPAAASTFSVALSRATGAPNVAVTMTVTPNGGSWPGGLAVTATVSSLAGSFDNTSLVGNGAAALAFNFTPTSSPGSVGTLTVSANGMTNSSGAQTYTVTPVASVVAGNRFDVVLNKSAAAVGAPVQVTVIPNGAFPTGTIRLAGTNGTFTPASSITLTSGSTTSTTVTYTPASAGEHVITATNSAALYNPYSAPLTVFQSSSGVPQSLSASLTRGDMATYQRDSASGNPTGFSFGWARGWGEVWLNVNALGGSTNGLWIRLYDAQSPGASSAVGSGQALHSTPVQVYGSVSGPGLIRILLPAGPFIYFAELATDSAFTNPVRISQRFRVGVVIGHFSRSQESGLSRAYAYSGNVPLPTAYTKTATWVGFDYRYPDTDSGWFMHDGATVDPYQYHYGESSSAGAQEIGRLIESQLGVCVGIAGSSASGGGLDSMVNHDGSLTGGFTGTVSAAVGNKFRYLWMATGGWDGVDGTNYPAETQAENRTRFKAAVDWIARTYPACAVVGWGTGASGYFGSDGSRPVGFTRNQLIFLNELEPANPMVVSKECYSWNEYFSGHATMAARVQYVRAGFRLLMAAELAVFGGLQTSNRGPRLGSAGTIRSGGRTISIPYSSANGAVLQAVSIACTNPSFTVGGASNADLASLFTVYRGGGYQSNGVAIKIDSAVINRDASTIDLLLSGNVGVTFADNTTASTPMNFSVHYAADFNASNNAVPMFSGRAVMITDDRVDTVNGIPHGWHMRPALDIPISTI